MFLSINDSVERNIGFVIALPIQPTVVEHVNNKIGPHHLNGDNFWNRLKK
jgi:hypothetical protein